MDNYYRTLTVAGSDSGGGAGIQADLKTFSALGCYGMSVITALTAQNTLGVTGIHPVSPEFIALQMEAVMTDIGADALKIGMLHSPEVITAVAECLQCYPCESVVVDPVMVTRNGDKLLQDDAVLALQEKLFPLATVITPNLAEASLLLNRKVTQQSHMADACRDLARMGCGRVFLKGGALSGRSSVDVLYDASNDSCVEFESQRVLTNNTHGTGCTISSAITASLAKGVGLIEAVTAAKEYIDRALLAGAEVKTGAGHGPIHHFHALWKA